MAYGKSFRGGLDPLFIGLFGVIALVNFLIALAAAVGQPAWIGISLVFHLVFGWRLATARRLASNQRAIDLERFRALKNPSTSN